MRSLTVQWWGMALVVLAATTIMRADLPAQVAARADAMTQRIERYEGSGNMVVGFSVRHTASGTPLFSHRADTRFTPASNLKLLTAAGALATLGGDFEFITNVYVFGSDVVIVGDFDPALGDPELAAAYERSIYAELDQWAQAIRRELGDESVGDIVLVAPGEPADWRHADWRPNQYTFWYAAPAAALNFHDNCIDVTFDVEGQTVTPELSPVSEYIDVTGSLTVGNRHVWSLTGNEDLSEVRMRGTVAQSTDEPLGVAIDNPPMLLGRVLADRLARAGVPMSGEFRLVASAEIPAGTEPVAQSRTPISDVLWRCNRHSLNLAAECLLLRSGDGTWPGSAEAMSATLVETFGLSPEEFVLRDGSGLSGGNRVTPSAMTNVLVQAVRLPGGGALLSSLPASGVSGRLINRLNEVPYTGRVLGKTGYIAGVQCLSGFILDARRRPVLTYSVLINRVPAGQGRGAQDVHDDLCGLLVDAVIAADSESD
jgi:D-alanyl-D-alanine carboxypeptidase/D-alanyl-D-alanine-endopeptidase (penicillin-binding protein 4)